MKLRTELRKRAMTALLNKISPEQFADMVVLGLQAGTEQTRFNEETGKAQKVIVPNWTAIQNSIDTIKDIWGIVAPKQVEDTTDQNDDEQSIDTIREQRRIIEAEIKELRDGRTETVAKEEAGNLTGTGEERPAISL